ncbi:signal peptidase II [Mesorhizobium sp. 65-26]|uniref:signal peptidase II n=1 Tax=Mesorhizobium sp. 65-26 TaxID=1895781 RepID=UPI0025D6BEE2|nr:signal peptidase II [Mesorhizobium sp. 65-26]
MRNEGKPDVVSGRIYPVRTAAATISFAALILDLCTKGWVRASLPFPDGLDPLPFVALRPRYNEGTTFGLFSGETTMQLMSLVVVTVLGLVVLCWWFARAREPWVIIGASLMAAGALGNLVDRIVVGMVTDFIGLHLGSWYSPIFNLADIWVVSGSFLVLFGFRSDRPQPE